MKITITKLPDGGRIECIEYSTVYRRTYTYNAAGLLTRYKDTDGAWLTITYNDAGQEVRYEDKNGVWELLQWDAAYKLRVSVSTPHIYWAGCRRFTREQAIEHWSAPHEHNIERAADFLAAVINHKE